MDPARDTVVSSLYKVSSVCLRPVNSSTPAQTARALVGRARVVDVGSMCSGVGMGGEKIIEREI
jgi:hypothetical protein